LREITPEQAHLAGGKLAHLGRIAAGALPVPGGFVVTAAAFARFMSHAGILERVRERLATVRIDDLDHIEQASAEIRELIAQAPLPRRDASRLLVLDRATGALAHHSFGDLPELLRPGDLLVMNRSRVIPARLLGTRAGGGTAEVLLARRRPDGLWTALLRPGRRLRAGSIVSVAPGFQVEVVGPAEEPGAGAELAQALRLVRLRVDGGDEEHAIERHGHIPLPPYIQRADSAADRERYQTVFAAEKGSVAAPTAGLHFTPELLSRLQARRVETATLVLHVGPGTFRPVEVADVREHRVPAEPFEVPRSTAEAVNRARAAGRRVIAVGTTATRTLEAATDAQGQLTAGAGDTALVIVPGHAFRALDGLVTNFHLPRSSLLLLVAALAGRARVLAAYEEAVRARYRFYSYGDAMLLV
jgi:S-adenosylmethionine:tRNA ribosyltransferase-isomerase